jgi:hypothetical protein
MRKRWYIEVHTAFKPCAIHPNPYKNIFVGREYWTFKKAYREAMRQNGMPGPPGDPVTWMVRAARITRDTPLGGQYIYEHNCQDPIECPGSTV